VVLVRATHVGVGTEGEMRTVHRQRVGVKRIGAGRERRVMFRAQVEIFPVLSDVGEGVAAHHGRVVSLLVVVRMESRLEVVGSPRDVSPGRVLTTILVVFHVGHVWTDRVGVEELLHERTSLVRIGNLMGLLPGVVDN
jgi:hypothetical protein